MLVFLLTFCAFVAIYWISYHELPDPVVWLAYILYAPSFAPLNSRGPIWWYAAVLILGTAALFQSYKDGGNSIAFKRSFLVLLLAYGVLAYCMGRGVDNNFLNLMPFTLLVLLSAFTANLPFCLRAVSAGMLASMIGWMAIFGWGIWQVDRKAGRLFEFAPTKVMQSFSFLSPEGRLQLKNQYKYIDVPAGNPDDVAHAIEVITHRSGEPVAVIDHSYLADENGPAGAWTAFHPAGNYAFFPKEWRVKFLARVENRLHKSGWVLIDKTLDTGDWLADYQSVYILAGEEDFNSYHGYHFVPKASQ